MSSKRPTRESAPLKKLSTRNKIIAAAAAVLTEEGGRAISARRIAARAGVSLALIHYNFESIEELMLEVLRGTSEQAMSIIRDRYSGPADFIDKWLADLAPVFEEGALFEPKSWLEIMGIVVNDDGLTETYRQEFADPNYAIMRDSAAESLEARGVADAAAAEVVASFALILKAGVLITALLGRNPAQEEAVKLAATLLRQHIESLSARERAPDQSAALPD
jgi:AcrR family transcriptional regulator